MSTTRPAGRGRRIVGSDGRTQARSRSGWDHRGTHYLGDPTITAANFTDGWLRTGDSGHRRPVT